MYGDVDAFKEILQLRAKQFKLYPRENQSDEDRFDEILTGFLVNATDMLNRDRKRDYEQEVEDGKRDKVPPGIIGIAYRLAANMAVRAMWLQNSQAVKNDDFETQMLKSEVFTPDIAADLLLYPAKTDFGLARLRGKKELEELRGL